MIPGVCQKNKSAAISSSENKLLHLIFALYRDAVVRTESAQELLRCAKNPVIDINIRFFESPLDFYHARGTFDDS